MSEFEAATKLFQSLGISQLFAPLISIIILLFLIKKYLFSNGVSKFLKSSVEDYLGVQREKITLELQVKERLDNLVEKSTSIENSMIESRRYQEQQIGNLEDIIRDHAAETKNLLFLLRKRTDKVEKDELQKIDTQYFKGKQGDKP